MIEHVDYPATKECCATCHFYREGECRSHHPWASFLDHDAVWPAVEPGNWCGEWKEAEIRRVQRVQEHMRQRHELNKTPDEE